MSLITAECLSVGGSLHSFSSEPLTPPCTPLPIQQEDVLCVCCWSKKRCSNSTTCSKRCAWFSLCRCPQCGRERDQSHAFCCIACASHSAHANWCPTCAVRQSIVGRDHCSDSCAAAAPNAMNFRPRRNKAALKDQQHHIASQADKDFVAIASLFGRVAAVSHIVKVAPHPERRRQYLNYRAFVEQRMSASRLPKVGHGGEGNELRRFVPLTVRCAMHSDADGFVTPCEDPVCEACSLLQYGFSMKWSGRLSHYCTSSVSSAHPWALPSAVSGLRAIAVARVVVGYPQVLSDSANIGTPWVEGYDSVVVTNGTPAQDGTYLFADVAMDLQSIVLVQ